MDVLKLIFTISAGCGGLFLIVVPIGAAVALSDDLRSRLLRRVPAWTVVDLLSVKARPRRVAVRGSTVAGDSVVTAPATGTPCLWFRLTVLRVDKVTTDSGHRWDETVVWSQLSGHTVWFHDGTARVPVEVPLLERALDGKGGLVERSLRTRVEDGFLRLVPPSVLRRNRNTTEIVLVEELVRDDVTATLFVRPVHRDGQLVLTGGRGYRVGVTDLTHAEVVDRYSGEAREGWWTVRFLLILGGAFYLCGMAGALLIR
ncbi:hypothetical protein [Virgisporangium aurantiacum]|uniref:hypothetical protein n=1 Tax=Virgisporangium aurantiacum TaxID=175570 RepID=UPI00195206C5|nr:hypothetical protein [Virgisporangium aurantiacum]